jgi:hypothetical protein
MDVKLHYLTWIAPIPHRIVPPQKNPRSATVLLSENLFNFPNIQKKTLGDIIDLVIMRKKPRYLPILSLYYKFLFPLLLTLTCIEEHIIFYFVFLQKKLYCVIIFDNSKIFFCFFRQIICTKEVQSAVLSYN